MRVLVLGASGMAGHVISLYLREHGHDVIGLSRRKLDFIRCIQGDVMDAGVLHDVVKPSEYDAVINAIGVLNQQAETHKERAAFLNAYLPHALAKITSGSNCIVVHLSTDCVFRGNTGPYYEGSFPDGESFYDRSKALGELCDGKNLTLRNSIVGPDINQDGIGLFNWFMKQDGTINGYAGVMWNGLTTTELAKIIDIALNNRITGLINMVPEQNISKYELLGLFNRYFRNDEVDILPEYSRKLDKTLVRGNDSLPYRPLDYEGQICEMAAWVKSHTSLYPHYQGVSK